MNNYTVLLNKLECLGPRTSRWETLFLNACLTRAPGRAFPLQSFCLASRASASKQKGFPLQSLALLNLDLQPVVGDLDKIRKFPRHLGMQPHLVRNMRQVSLFRLQVTQ